MDHRRTTPIIFSKVRTKCGDRPVLSVKPVQKVKFHKSVKNDGTSAADYCCF